VQRKQKKYHFIYKTICILNGKYYIGMHSSNNIDDGYLGSGKRLRYSIRKYGEENHKREILKFFNSRKELIAKEKEIVNLNEIAKEECMNIMVGGEGGFISEEQQRRRSSAAGKKHIHLFKTDPEYRKKFNKNMSKSIKRAIDQGRIKTWKENYSWLGKHHTEETKRKIGEANSRKQKGELNSQFGTCWITNGKKNKKIKKIDTVPEGFNLGRTLN